MTFEEKKKQILNRKKKPTMASVQELYETDASLFGFYAVQNLCSVTFYCEHILLPELVAEWKKKGGKKSE